MVRSLLSNAFRHQTMYWVRQDLQGLAHRILQLGKGRRPSNVKPSSRYLNVGCGPHGVKSDDWFNIDGFGADSVDYVCVINRDLPFANGRFEGIYSEHFLEHLTPPEAKVFLVECHRILKPGGTLRLSVPDCELYLRKYFDDRRWMLERRGGIFRTPMEVVNEVFRQRYEHQYGYDYETLSAWLKEAGFDVVQRSSFGEGNLPALLIDQQSRQFESLYLEARKSPSRPS